MTREQILSELKLFKSYSCTDSNATNLNLLIQNGILMNNSVALPSNEVIDCAIELFNMNGSELNASFHKSFDTIMKSNYTDLIVEQLLHYLSVYTLNMDEYGNSYIPQECLQIPELKDDVCFTVISYITIEDLKQRILNIVNKNVGLSSETLSCIKPLLQYIPLTEVNSIKNKEVKTMIYDYYNYIPQNGLEFIAYLVYKLTDSTLLIKSNDVIQSLINCNKSYAYDILTKYIEKYSYDTLILELSKYFLRYKKLLLALKCKSTQRHTKYGTVINKILNKCDKLADRNKVVVNTNLLDKLYYEVCHKKYIDDNFLQNIDTELSKTTVYRLIRLYNLFRSKVLHDNINVYKIRNGKLFIKSLNERYNQILSMIYKHICDRVSNNVDSCTIKLPTYISYAVPTTDKQTLQYIPNGSTINIPKSRNIVITVHWKNQKGYRIDLDLSAKTHKDLIAWNNKYLSENKDIIFSGDMTTGEKVEGASESILIKHDAVISDSIMLQVTDYTNTHIDIEFELIISYTDDNTISETYTVNPNNVICKIPMIIPNKGVLTSIGFVTSSTDILQFTLYSYILSNNVTVVNYDTPQIKNLLKYLESDSSTNLMLNDLLEDCNANIIYSNDINKKSSDIEEHIDYDLSVNKLTKNTFLSLISDKE